MRCTPLCKLQLATAPCFPTAQTWRPPHMDNFLQHMHFGIAVGEQLAESAITLPRGDYVMTNGTITRLGQRREQSWHQDGCRVSVTRVTGNIHFTIWNTTTTNGHVIGLAGTCHYIACSGTIGHTIVPSSCCMYIMWSGHYR